MCQEEYLDSRRSSLWTVKRHMQMTPTRSIFDILQAHLGNNTNLFEGRMQIEDLSEYDV